MSPISFILKIFSMLAVFRNIEGTIYNVFQHCEKEDFQRSLVISPSYAKNVSIPEIFWNKGGFPYEIFQLCETKTLTKSRDTPPSSLIRKIFDTRIFLKHRRVPPRKLWALRDEKLLAQKDNILFLCVEFFGNRFFSEKHKGSPAKVFETVRQKLWHKIVIQPPLLLSIKIFDTRRFLKHRRVPLRNFWTLWDKKLLAQKNDISFLFVNFFDTCFFSETQKGCPTKVFGFVRQKLWQKIVIHAPLLLSIKCFDTRNFLKHRRVLNEIFGLCRTKN